MLPVRKKRGRSPYGVTEWRNTMNLQRVEIREKGIAPWIKQWNDGEGTAWGTFEKMSTDEYKGFHLEASMATANESFIKTNIKEMSEVVKAHADGHGYADHPLAGSLQHINYAARLEVGAEACVGFLAELPHLIEMEGDKAMLKYRASGSLLGGGWKEYYGSTYAPLNNEDAKLEQRNSVWSLSKAVVGELKVYNPPFKALMTDIENRLGGFGYSFKVCREAEKAGVQVLLERCDILANWSASTHFRRHQDWLDTGKDSQELSYMSVIVNLSPYRSTFKIVGSQAEILLDSIGIGAVFPGTLFHMSGENRRGTVKLALFYKRVVPRTQSPRIVFPFSAGSSSEATTGADEHAPAPVERWSELHDCSRTIAAVHAIEVAQNLPKRLRKTSTSRHHAAQLRAEVEETEGFVSPTRSAAAGPPHSVDEQRGGGTPGAHPSEKDLGRGLRWYADGTPM